LILILKKIENEKLKMVLQINNDKIKIKQEIKEGNYYFVESQYKFKPHTLYKIIKETNNTIKCLEMEYNLIQGTYNDRTGTTSNYYYFKTNVYMKNDWKIKTFYKQKINRKNIWNWNKLKKEEYFKTVDYLD
tara:strand:+ start:82 stop:477 length:396 start_codon:yes stop_codon:yes gene_type:complete